MYPVLMTVFSFLLLGASTLGDGLIHTFALYASGLFIGHALTDALNRE